MKRLAARLFRSWRHAAAIIADAEHAADDQPVPYWPADPIGTLAAAVQCGWCKPRPAGRCTCTGKCGHNRCLAPRSLFTADDLEILDGKKLP